MARKYNTFSWMKLQQRYLGIYIFNYGDKAILENQLESMKACVEYIKQIKNIKKCGLKCINLNLVVDDIIIRC